MYKRSRKIDKRTQKTIQDIKNILSCDYFVTRKVLALEIGKSHYAVDEKTMLLLAREEVEKIKVKDATGSGRCEVAFRLL